MVGTYCYLCRVVASATHDSCSRHRVARQIAAVAMERVSNYVAESDRNEDDTTSSETKAEMDKSDETVVSYCDYCNVSVPTAELNGHFRGRDHTMAFLTEQALEELVQDYIGEEDLKLLEAPNDSLQDSGNSVDRAEAVETYRCHICELEVPIIFGTEHERGPRHRSCRALICSATKRVRDMLAPPKSKDTSKHTQEDTESQKFTVKRMKKLLSIYTGEDIDDCKLDDEKAEPRTAESKKLTAKQYFTDILPYLSFVGTYYTVIIDDSEFITIKIGRDTLKVHVNNLNGLYNYGDNDRYYMNCRLCDGFENKSYGSIGEEDKAHVMSLGHIRNVFTPIDSVHLIRKIDDTHATCALCNVYILSHQVNYHILKDPHHTMNLKEALQRGEDFKESKEHLKITVYSPTLYKPSQINTGFQKWPVNVQNQGRYTGTLFGSAQNNTNGFGSAQNTAVGFGSHQKNTGGFGTAQNITSGFGSAQNNIGGFGTAQNNTVGFGSPQKNTGGFGTAQNITSGFGSALNNIGGFGSAQNNIGGFGSAQNNIGGFGSAQNKTGGFGSAQNKTGGFGSAQNSSGCFGSAQNLVTAQGNFSEQGCHQKNPAFGNAQNDFGVSSTTGSVFGGIAGLSAQSKTGFSSAQNNSASFGSAQNSTGFGQNKTGFGATQNHSAPFGTAQNITQNNAGLFGSAQNTAEIDAQKKTSDFGTTQDNVAIGSAENPAGISTQNKATAFATTQNNAALGSVQDTVGHNKPADFGAAEASFGSAQNTQIKTTIGIAQNNTAFGKTLDAGLKDISSVKCSPQQTNISSGDTQNDKTSVVAQNATALGGNQTDNSNAQKIRFVKTQYCDSKKAFRRPRNPIADKTAPIRGKSFSNICSSSSESD